MLLNLSMKNLIMCGCYISYYNSPFKTSASTIIIIFRVNHIFREQNRATNFFVSLAIRHDHKFEFLSALLASPSTKILWRKADSELDGKDEF